jgi:hypothetical protein
MRNHAYIIAISVLLYLVTLFFGMGLSRNLRLNDPRPSGKPLASGMANIHKLLAFATIITAAVAIRRLHRGMQFTSIELTTVLLAGLFFLLMIITGSFLSRGKAPNEGLQAVHKVISFLAVIPTFGVIYLLTRGRW